MLTLIGYAGQALGATLFATLAVLVHQRQRGGQLSRRWMLASMLTAFGALISTTNGMINIPAWGEDLAETIRNAGWLLVVGAIGTPALDGRRDFVRKMLPRVLVSLLVLQLAVDLAGDVSGLGAAQRNEASWLLRCTFAIGAMFYLQRQFARRSLSGIAIPGQAWLAAALTILWVYDFNHYLLAWLTAGPSDVIGATRGYVLAVIAPMMALSLFGEGERPVRVSRPVAMRLVSGAIIAIYFICVLLFVAISRGAGQGNERLVELVVLFALSVAVLVLLPPTTVRSWLRVAIAKHLFAHRYDYRAEWMHFATTVAGSGRDAPPLVRRVARAVAQVIEAPAALLLLREDDGSLKAAGHWNWPEPVQDQALSAVLATRIEQRGWIVDLAADGGERSTFAPLLPEWLRDDRAAWLIAPLVHRESLIGVVILLRPPVARRPDWEDLDVLRVVGTQAAATLSEAQSRQALDEAQRFDEFNRRFAFILHDLKNLVSQMSLLANNAERHADNPAFRADMIFTLKETAGRMSDMLARLARNDAQSGGKAAGVDLRALLDMVAARIDSSGRVAVTGSAPLAHVDVDGLERALGHLIQNALDASHVDQQVAVRLSADAGQPMVEVIDKGSGMSAEFIRNELFRPFASTKASGFGLGAHEARLLVTAMGGTLAVESREGDGTCFTLMLPPSSTAQDSAPDQSDAPSHTTSVRPARQARRTS